SSRAGCTPVSAAHSIASRPGASAGTSGKGLVSPAVELPPPEDEAAGSASPSCRVSSPALATGAAITAAADPARSSARRRGPCAGGAPAAAVGPGSAADVGPGGEAEAAGEGTGGAAAGGADGRPAGCRGRGAPGRPLRRRGAGGRLTAIAAPASAG